MSMDLTEQTVLRCRDGQGLAAQFGRLLSLRDAEYHAAALEPVHRLRVLRKHCTAVDFEAEVQQCVCSWLKFGAHLS